MALSEATKETLEWLASQAVLIALGGIALASVYMVEGSGDAQKRDGGVIWVAVLAFATSIGILNLCAKRQPLLGGASNMLETMIEYRYLAAAVICLLPIGTSWHENETLKGALNPIGYWRSELAKEQADRCQTFKAALQRQKEQVLVADRKFDLQIITPTEYRQEIAAWKLMEEVTVGCIKQSDERIQAIQNRIAILSR